jgi:hypothetical protein
MHRVERNLPHIIDNTEKMLQLLFLAFLESTAADSCREIAPDNKADVLGYENYILLEFFHHDSILGEEKIHEIEDHFEVFDLYVFCVNVDLHKEFAKEFGVTSTPAMALFYSEEVAPRAITTDFTEVMDWLEDNLPDPKIYEDSEAQY